MRSNFHTHTTWCDGKDEPEAVVRTAIDKGFEAIGFSSHVSFPEVTPWVLGPDRAPEYAREIRALAAKYAGRIKVFLGAEADYFAKAAAYPVPESVPFAPKWLDATHVYFQTAQALPAGIEIKYPREKDWIQFWDDAASTEHVVELPSVDAGDYEYRPVQWSFSGGGGFEIVR